MVMVDMTIDLTDMDMIMVTGMEDDTPSSQRKLLPKGPSGRWDE
jgi:hypothetical protein